jgi:hypothetical protein
MLDFLEGKIRRLLRIPAQPEPPAGDPASVRVFRPSTGFFRYRLLAWSWHQLTTVAGFVFGILFIRRYGFQLAEIDARILDELPAPIGAVPEILFGFEVLAIALFFLQLPISYALMVLDYRCRWYMITDRSLRIREGRWRIQERTMTFSNVQNISIRQGPLQRLFGIADLVVQSAGGGGSGTHEGKDGSEKNLHLGFFRGIDNAPELRALIRKYQQRAAIEESVGEARTGGSAADPSSILGAPRPQSSDSDPLAAAQEVLREVQGLSRSLT